MGNFTIFQTFENPKRGRQARNFTTKLFRKFQISNRLRNMQIFFQKLSLGAPGKSLPTYGLTFAGTVKTKNIAKLHTANCGDRKHDTKSDIHYCISKGERIPAIYIAEGHLLQTGFLIQSFSQIYRSLYQHKVIFPFLNVFNVHVFISLFNLVRC